MNATASQSTSPTAQNLGQSTLEAEWGPSEAAVGHPLSESEVHAAVDILRKRLPPELAIDVIEAAEYHVREVIGSRHEIQTVKHDGHANYLACHVPYVGGRDRDASIVKRVTFRIRSHDQGFSIYRDKHGGHDGPSWFDVEVWREGPDREMVQADGPHRLQFNVHAKREFTDHVISWSSLEDDPDTSQAGWIVEADTKRWEEGHLKRNGAFVRKLRGGDVIRVVMWCRYSGWTNTVESCQVEIDRASF